MVTMRCPRCGGTQLVRLNSDWLECRSDVIYSGAPPELTGLPHPVHQYGPCSHKFEPVAVRAAEAAQRQKIERDAAVKADAEAAEATRRDESVAVLRSSSDPQAILEALQVREGMLPADVLKPVLLRLMRGRHFSSPQEMLTLEGRGSLLGYVLSRGGYTTQWGKWVEVEREPVYLAAGAGHEVIDAHHDVPASVQEGFDVWVDASGGLWSDGRSSGSARLAIGGSSKETRRLVLQKGKPLRLQRRKAEYMGWEIRVPDARGAWPYGSGSIEYTRVLRSLLGNRSA
jgi:hypothetical protein